MENETMRPQEEETIDLIILLHDVFRGFIKLWWVVLLLIAVGAGVCYYRSVQNYYPMYKSTAAFTVVTSDSNDANYSYWYYYDQSTASQMADTFPYILESELLTDLVKQDLGVDYINGSITASAIENSNLFSLSVISRSPEDAKAILDSVIENYPDVSQYVIGATKLNMIEAPELPDAPYNSNNYKSEVKKGIFVGAAAGMLLLGLYAITRRTVRSEREIKEVLNTYCLGSIPEVIFKKYRTKKKQEVSIYNRKTGTVFQESVKGIALRLFRQMQENNQKVLMVTSTELGEGVSTIAANLAYAIAQMDKNVLLIKNGKQDGEKENIQYDFEHLLNGECILKEALIWQEKEKIWNLLCRKGFRAAEEAVGKESVKTMIKRMRPAVDIIIIDAMSCRQMSDVVLTAECADLIAYVIRQDTAKAARIMECIEDVCKYEADFAGCILNGVQTGISGYGYGYGYGKYGRYSGYYYRRYGSRRYEQDKRKDDPERRS